MEGSSDGPLNTQHVLLQDRILVWILQIFNAGLIRLTTIGAPLSSPSADSRFFFPGSNCVAAQVSVCGLCFLVLFLGNFFTTVAVVRQKVKSRNLKAKKL